MMSRSVTLVATFFRRSAFITSNVSTRHFSHRSINKFNYCGNVFLKSISPGHTLDAVKPPKYWVAPDPVEPNNRIYTRKPISSAHAIDLSSDIPELSTSNYVYLNPTGAALHSRYGDLGNITERGIPLEYLPLLHPAAQGASAVRSLLSGKEKRGTVLVYGASQPAGMAACQLASSSGCAVVAIVDGQHSSNVELLNTLKYTMLDEPSIVLPEEYSLVRSKLSNIVNLIVAGEEPNKLPDASRYHEDFISNLIAYRLAYPEEQVLAAVSTDIMKFHCKDKDKKEFRNNMESFLSQYPTAALPIDEHKLKSHLNLEMYASFKREFKQKTTAVVSGDETGNFDPVRIMIEKLNEKGGTLVEEQINYGFGRTPYEFDFISNTTLGNNQDVVCGAPMLGAIISATPDLLDSVMAVENAGKSLREKVEALCFLPECQKNAYAAARGVIALAHAAGKDALVVGGELPGLLTVKPTEQDVNDALNAMEIGHDGRSRLNYFIQVYRAGDYPAYINFAIHRAMEDLSGPRQIVVTQ